MLQLNYKMLNETVVLEEGIRLFGDKAKTLSMHDLATVMIDKIKTIKTKEMVTCGDCGGGSPIEFSRCPFCGAADAESEEEARAAKAKPVLAIVEAPASKPKLEKKKEEKKMQLVAVKEMNGVTKATSSDLVVGVKVLDANVQKFHQMKGDGARWFWETGRHVYENLFANQAWRARIDDNGKALYKNFEVFAKEELGVSKDFVWRMMKVSQDFTLDDCVKYGTTNLKLLITVPKADREEILQDIEKKKLKTREVEKRVKGKTKSKRGQGVGGGRPKSLAGLVREYPQQTIILKTGKTTVKFESSKKEGAIARTLTDGPVAEIETLNGVKLSFSLFQGPGGQLSMSMSMSREKA